MQYSKGSRVALGYFTDLTLRKAFNQWLAWASDQQQYSSQLHLAMQARECTSALAAVFCPYSSCPGLDWFGWTSLGVCQFVSVISRVQVLYAQ